MGRANIGNWLLILGTVFGALAAANSHRAGNTVELASGTALAGEFLLHHIRADGSEWHGPVPDAADWTALVPAGTELTTETVAKLLQADVDTVKIRVPAQPVESVSGRSGMEGRVLAEDVVLSTESRRFEAGHELKSSDLRELREGGVSALAIEGAAEAAPIGAPGTFKLVNERLAQALDVVIPTKIVAGSFLSAERVDALEEAGVQEVRVQIPKKFSFGAWDQSLLFLAGVVLMVGGITLKRSAAGRVGDVVTEGALGGIAETRAKIEEITGQIAALAERVDSLSAAEIHAEVDPLINDGFYRVVEARHTLRSALGTAGFAEVMSAFSTGERKINRAWSAAVDGYVEEARLAVRESVMPLEEALAAIEARSS